METRYRTQLKEDKEMQDAGQTLIDISQMDHDKNIGIGIGNIIPIEKVTDEEYAEYRKERYKDIQESKSTLRSKNYRLFYYHRLIQEGIKDKKLRSQLDDEWKNMNAIDRNKNIKIAEDFFDQSIS